MAQYDDSRNPFSAASGRPEASSPWSEPAPPAPEGGRGGLQLPGEASSTWGSDGFQRPSPVARRRNQWRQHQQLTPDFGVAPAESEPEGRPPTRGNASLPPVNRGAAAQPQRSPAPTRPEVRVQQSAPVSPRPPQPGTPPLQMHPHSIHPSTLNPGAGAAPLGRSGSPAGALPPNVTPLRTGQRRWSQTGRGEASQTGRGGASPAAAQAARGLVPEPGVESGPLPEGPPRRSRAATARRRLANPPLPLLYLIRLVILGVGVAAIAGTLLSVLSPSNVASPGNEVAPPARETAALKASGPLVQGGAATTIASLRLASEFTHLKGELENLATLTPGLTPLAFAVDLDSGQYVDLGGGEPIAAASTIKMPILVAFLQQVDAGTMDLNQAMVLREEDVAGGSGTMHSDAVGTQYTALEVATHMIVSSDNTAANMMIAALGGMEALNQTFASWGLEQTLLRNPLPDLDGTNTTSAKDLALLMALIDQGGLLTPRSRDRMFSIMQRTENASLIPSGITDGSITAHKTGDIGTMLGDVALIDVPNGKRYALALLVQRPDNDGRASELIRRMTTTVHTEMAQPVAPVGTPSAAPAASSSPAPAVPASPADPYTTESPTSVEPVDVSPPSREPARDEIPPG
ncbi:serine hydrolase [Nodosilinea nodulosa]|uniref:serine hydrolase n=1 Tax=Nodosilinea nodulosa TaxID=416001 RepID=UPI000305B09C|nr:serine hydrolase [Nodosilinea nodulosa]